MKSPLYIRVDGSASVGLGHVVRCMALAHMLKDDCMITFFCRDLPAVLGNELKEMAVALDLIESEEVFFQSLAPGVMVVLDGYHFDIAYQREVRGRGARLVCVDDIHAAPFEADLIINHAPGVRPDDYHARTDTLFALGPAYALLRPEFLAAARANQRTAPHDTVLICFGGADQLNLTMRALEICLEDTTIRAITVVTGAAYQHTAELLDVVGSSARVCHVSAVSASQLLRLMQQSFVAIVPASGILYEAMATGCRVISGMYVENQKWLYQRLLEQGAFFDAGCFEPSKLRGALKAVKADASHGSPRLIDGLSSGRIRQIFADLAFEVSEVTVADRLLLFEWANDPTVRQHALQKQAIDWSDHVQWFRQQMQSGARMFLLRWCGRPAGQVRYDWKVDYWLVDYSIDRLFRGRGLGKLLLARTLSTLKKGPVRAWVHEANVPSRRCFEALDFGLVKTEEIEKEKYLVFEKS